MSKLFATHPRILTRLVTVTAAAAILVGVGCSDDDNNNGGGTPTPTTTMVGAFVGGGDGGKITVTVSSTMLAPGLPTTKLKFGAGGSRLLRPALAGAADVGASGSLDLSGGPVIGLTGNYSQEADTLHLSGGGYTFSALYDSSSSGESMVGGYSGPNGPGFFGIVKGEGGKVIQVFCGAFENAGVTVTGRWNMIINGDDVGGAAFANGDTDGAGFEGAVTGTGNPRTITFSGGNSSFSLTGTGSWNTTTNSITGTWETSDGISTLDSGTWQGTPCE